MSKIEVNQISSQCGSTLTVGQSGDTVTLASGATQTGFGRTGTVDWDTTAKTASFTAVSGTGYFVNTTSGAITLTLPTSPSAGDIVSFKDYANTFDTNNLTIGRNGEPIAGSTADAIISVEGQSGTLIYVDGTKGWMIVNASTDADLPAPTFVTATGGTITCCGDYKIHTFTGPGTFCVSSAGNAAGSNSVEYIVVAGGGSGGSGYYGGGAGAGGFRFAAPSLAPLTYPAKPLAGSNITVTATAFPIVVGAGGGSVGPTNCIQGNPGSNSVFSTITSSGGGGAGSWGNGPGDLPITPGLPGGSGGGAGSVNGAASGPGGRVAGAGNTPPVSPAQGEPGGTGGFNVPSGPCGTASSAGGGGAIQAGQDHNPGPGAGGFGGEGAGLPTAFGSNGVPCGSFRYYAGGGGGAGDCGTTNVGGKGGGGSGGRYVPGALVDPGDGTTNSGGGGGGAIDNSTPASISGSGGSGIVIIRYKFQ